ncbi:nuclear RNA export factor 5 [Phyllostomus discolor]|uniref:Nuclear RNA export factor 5 n=1 Tax=Phyllostomus discolor TaxID=89673 RepID=A0A833ZGP1_9CHIR|nr:nuclear RNA export factor 5 [Phyllostomus discolor]
MNSIQSHCSVPFTPFHHVQHQALFFVQGASATSALKDVSYKICDGENQKLKSDWELDKIRGLKLKELWLEGNPLCGIFPDQTTYISAIRKCFPKLFCLESYKGSEMLKNLVFQFLLQNNLFEYLKGNRNMKKVKDPDLRVQLLKHTKNDIVCSLCVLPKTQHDLISYMVDLSVQTEMLLCFSVSGVFKEVEEKSQGSVHAFTGPSSCLLTAIPICLS